MVTDVSDLNWIVKNAGIVVPKNDAASMARAFAEMVELGAHGRQVLGCNGRARVMEHFRLASIVEQYSALYETVLAHNVHEVIRLPLNSRPQSYSESATSDSINAAV